MAVCQRGLATEPQHAMPDATKRRSGVLRRQCTSVALVLLVVAGPTLCAPADGFVDERHIDLDHWRELGVTPVPANIVGARAPSRVSHHATTAAEEATRTILFGDLHVHTSYSIDAFLRALPMILGADGAVPPVDACNYARYIAQLDFFAITDHAEEITPENWKNTIQALRLCASVGGADAVPDIVPFLGFEWSQVGQTPATHWGHHNVIFKSLDAVPARPIRAPGSDNAGIDEISPGIVAQEPTATYSFYQAYNAFAREVAGVPKCPTGAPFVRDDCQEVAATPGELLSTLKTWGLPHIVIPHGSAWGVYTPSGSTWDHELNAQQYDPNVVKLIEVYSGHGASEVFRPFGEFSVSASNEPTCNPPTSVYLPECWQAGEIIRARCAVTGGDATLCEERAAEARRNFLKMPGVSGWTIVPNSTPEEWLDAGQARDMFMPAFNYRPGKSVQYGLALSNFDDPRHPLRFQWGFVGSTDTHSARPGHGFKSVDRIQNVDLWAALKTPALLHEFLNTTAPPGTPLNRARDPATVNLSDYGGGAFEFERLGSFLSLGGIVAVHARDRSREAIWQALQQREVYATSGARILLWFYLLNGKDAHGRSTMLPMGRATQLHGPLHFRVHAMGSEKQKPGCPEFVKHALAKAQLSRMADNECYFPTSKRYNIERLEVVRIRPQRVPGEDVRKLIDDPWKTILCKPASECTADFSDKDFKRDSVYYVRALEEPTPVINGKNLRTTFDENGNPVAVALCYMDTRTDPKDDCLASVQQRAWSSPIFVTAAP